MKTVRWLDLLLGLVVLAALLVVAWGGTHGWWRHPPSAFLSFAFSASLGVLVLAAIGVSERFGAIVDWFRVRVPPVAHDELAGDLTYRSGIWRGERLLWLEGRRAGPDPDLVRAGSLAVGDADALATRARAYAIAEGVPPGHIGALQGIRPLRVATGIVVVLAFAHTNREDVVDVTFRDGEPIEADVH